MVARVEKELIPELMLEARSVKQILEVIDFKKIKRLEELLDLFINVDITVAKYESDWNWSFYPKDYALCILCMLLRKSLTCKRENSPLFFIL